MLRDWLPGGKIKGKEYVCADITGGAGKSFSVNIETGLWADFAAEMKGGDPVALYAAIHGCKQGEALSALAEELGLDGQDKPPRRSKLMPVDTRRHAARGNPQPTMTNAPPPEWKLCHVGKRSTRLPVLQRWAYLDGEGNLLGYVCRFDHPDGGKEYAPLLYVETKGGGGWQWKSFPAPRPLYGLDRLERAPKNARVLLVEGEKCADAAQRLLPGFVVMTWPGGANAASKADFSPLANRDVLVWPDADKPGWKAALKIAGLPAATYFRLLLIVIPPQGVEAGWDLADAEASGWVGCQVIDHIERHAVFVQDFAHAVVSQYGPEKRPGRDSEDEAAAGRLLVRLAPGSLVDAVNACEEILSGPNMPLKYRVLQRAGGFYRIIDKSNPMASGDSFLKDQRALSLAQVDRHFLLDVLSRVCRFKKFDKRSEAWKPTEPGRDLADRMLSRFSLSTIPLLRGILHCPTVRRDGSLLVTPGYDAKTQYYLSHSLKIQTPDSSTQKDAQAAAHLLKELLSGFRFVGAVDRAVALALLVSAVVRPAVDHAPLFAVTAPTPGSGKSTLIDVAGILATGRRVSVLSATEDRAEFEKRLNGCILFGDSFVSLDNYNGVLRSDLLCQATTSETIMVRPLGKSAQVTAPNTALWTVNGNNLGIAGDLRRRTLLCRLDADCERPEERAFAFDPRQKARTLRGEFVSAILTLVRAYIEAGRPDVSVAPYGGFDAWSQMVRQALIFAGEPDPCFCRSFLQEQDPETERLGALLKAWSQSLGSSPLKVNALIAKCEEGYSELQEILHDIAGEGEVVNPRTLGQWLKRQTGRVAGGLKLMQKPGSNMARWQVQPVTKDQE